MRENIMLHLMLWIRLLIVVTVGNASEDVSCNTWFVLYCCLHVFVLCNCFSTLLYFQRIERSS